MNSPLQKVRGNVGTNSQFTTAACYVQYIFTTLHSMTVQWPRTLLRCCTTCLACAFVQEFSILWTKSAQQNVHHCHKRDKSMHKWTSALAKRIVHNLNVVHECYTGMFCIAEIGWNVLMGEQSVSINVSLLLFTI